MKLFSLFIFTLFTGVVVAQNDSLLNPSFERWDSVGENNRGKAQSWFSNNQLHESQPDRGIRRSTDAFDGNYSLELVSFLPDSGSPKSFTSAAMGAGIFTCASTEKDYWVTRAGLCSSGRGVSC